MKKFFLALLCFLIFIPQVSTAEEKFSVDAKNVIAVEADTGKIFYEKDADTVTGVASISKLLSLYLVYEAVENGNLNWNTTIPISDYAYDLTLSYVSNVPLEKKEYSVQELIESIIIVSANSPMVALAEYIAGSEPKFVDMMTLKLQEWGINDAKLVNSTGLNNAYLGEDNIYPGTSTEDENMLSAKDVAIVAQHLINDYPEILEITSKRFSKFHNEEIYNYNSLLKGGIYAYDGVNGLMTGASEQYGESFVSSSDIDDMRIITVVLNTDDTTVDSRFTETVNLLNHIVSNYYVDTILEKGESYNNSKATVNDGKKNQVSIIAKSDLKVVRPVSSASNEPKISINTDNHGINAKIEEGQVLGNAVFEDEDLVGSGYIASKPSVDMISKEKVKRSFFLKVWWNHFVNYVNEKL